MAKTYVLRTDSTGVLDVYWTEGEHRNSCPPVIDAEFAPLDHLQAVTLYMLADYFSGEEDAETKARLLARGVGRRIAELGRQRAELHTNGKRSFPVTEAELNDLVIESLLDYTKTDANVEYVGGIRRDTLRIN